MKQNYTDITVIIDKSGSMWNLQHDTIGGFNVFLTEQQKGPGTATLSLVQFENFVHKIYTAVNVNHVAQLTAATYHPSGGTALLDAVGLTIKETGERLAAMAESARPERVIFLIITDGEENASHQYTKAQVKQMIQHQQDVYKWDFQFLGANIDAVAEADSLGIARGKALNYSHTSSGVNSAYSLMSKNTTLYRSAVDVDTAKARSIFTEADQAEALKP